MNTKKIYIARLGVIKFKDLIEPGEEMAYFYDLSKYALVREAKYKKRYVDLETRKKYNIGPTKDKIGYDFLVPGTFEEFNSFTGNEKTHLTKNKVIKLYRNKRR